MCQVVLSLSLSSNAVGPFNVYTGSTATTPILTELTREHLITGVSYDFPAEPTGTTYTIIFENTQPDCDESDEKILSKTIILYSEIPPAYLLIEPQSIGNDVAEFMNNNNGSNGFYGLWASLGFGPTTDEEITNYMKFFAINEGIGNVPNIISIEIPQTGSTQFLFDEVTIEAGLIGEEAWYTFFIPDDSIGGVGTSNRVTKINIKEGFGDSTEKVMSSTWYNTIKSINPDDRYIAGTYRMYSTYPDVIMRLQNNNEIKFRGGQIN